MIIRLYTDNDKQACLDLFDSNCPLYFAVEEREQFEDWLDHSSGQACYYVLEDTVTGEKNSILACGGIFYDSRNDSTGLAWGMVHSTFHKNGYGSHLTTFRLMQLDSQYPGRMQRLETSQHTVSFYEKMGFHTIHFQRDGFGSGLDKYEMIRIADTRL